MNTSSIDGKEQAQRLAKELLKLISKNEMKFVITDQEYKQTVESLMSQKTPYTDNQLSFIDGLYEKYMKFGGLGHVPVKHDYVKKW